MSADQLRRVLGPLGATCVVIGAIIGVGIFFTPSSVAKLAGSSGLALTAWVVGGFIAMMGALTFASLGRVYSGAGAQYEILRDAYGPLPAFLFVFCNATAIQAGATAIIAIVCMENIGVLVRGAAPGGAALATGSATLIIALALVNVLGVRFGSGVQNFTVFAKVLVLITIVALAATLTPSAPPPAAPRVSNAAVAASAAPAADLPLLAVLFSAIVPTFFSYGGWQHALWIAGEVRDARRNVPLAIMLGVSLVVLVYISSNWAYLQLLGFEGVAGSPTLAADAVSAVWPRYGRTVIAAGVAISALGVLNAQLLSGPRLVYRMAADGRFFAAFARVHGSWGTPIAAILLIGGLALVLLFAAGRDGVDKLLAGVVFIDGVFFALTGLAPLVLRRRPPHAATDFGYGYPAVPLIFVLGEVGIMFGAYAAPATRQAALIGVCWIVAAAIVFLIGFRRPAPKPG